MPRDTFYGQPLNQCEQAIAEDLRRLSPGQHAPFNACKATRALFGPWFYVENRSGYRCEIAGAVPTAIHVRNLNRALHREVVGD